MLKVFNNLVKDIQKFLNKLNKMTNKNKLFLVILVVLSSVVLHYVYNKIGIDVMGKLRLLNPLRLMEGMNNNKKFILLKMTGCGHCEELQPHWNNAVKANKTSIEMADYERGTKEGKKLCDKHNVRAFPTMLFIDGQNKATTYEGGRTKDSILAYLSSKDN